MYLIRLLIKRFLQAAYYERALSLMLKVCFTSIVIGTFALSLVFAVMQGFEKATRAQLQGINPDIFIKSSTQPLAYQKLRTVLLQEYSACIKEVTPYYYGHGLLAVNQETDISPVFMIMGINPSTEKNVSSLASFIKDKENNSFELLFSEDGILMGSSAAEQYDLQVGNVVELLYVPNTAEYTKSLTLEKITVHIAGIFKSGVDEFDAHVLIMNTELFQQIFPERGLYQVGIKVNEQCFPPSLIVDLKKRLELMVISWKELYPAILSALTLEKYAMTFILILITLLASMNIIALLFMFITHKRKDLIIFKAMGMTNAAIRIAFIMVGMIITLSATFLGLCAAGVVSWLLESYKLITLPDVYYVTHLPAHFTVGTVVFVLLLATIMSFGASWFSTQWLRRYSVNSIVKSE